MHKSIHRDRRQSVRHRQLTIRLARRSHTQPSEPGGGSDHLRLGRVYAEMGSTFWVSGDLDRAIAYGQRALALATTLAHIGLQAWAHLTLGQVYQEWHIPLFVPRDTAALGLTYALAGRIEADLALVEQGMEQAVARGRPRGLALAPTWLSEAYLLAGHREKARQRAVQAVDLARQHLQRGTQA